MIGELRLLYLFCAGEARSTQALARLAGGVDVLFRRTGGSID